MLAKLTEQVVATIQDAARKLTGRRKRAFQAKVALDYLDGSPRRAETVLGWGREAVEKGLKEHRGIPTTTSDADSRDPRGRRKTQQRLPRLEEDLRALVEPHSQADPKFQSPLAYTRMTAAAVRQALVDHKGYQEQEP